eukprot:TRINITY_DN533_c0_g1_i27.p1 TRINITY_DN533_c0_g1~~TRINITY_DN533_c0_g1_i27.p1  ORF type:complete len:308 (-),score=31.27 TRINITY_DN533_c0_g1_i27:20-943(-)
MGLKMCTSKPWYDFSRTEAIPILTAMTVTYAAASCYLVGRFILFYVKKNRPRIDPCILVFQIAITAGLITRLFYFPGTVVPFCYERTLYMILGEYPSLFQSIAICMLTVRFIETLQRLPIELGRGYAVFKKVILVFVMVYPILFIGLHTLALVKAGDFQDKAKYIAVAVAQTLILVSFTIMSFKLTELLKKVYSELASDSLRFLLVLISCLLLTRIIVAVLNVFGIIRDRAGKKVLLLVYNHLAVGFCNSTGHCPSRTLQPPRQSEEAGERGCGEHKCAAGQFDKGQAEEHKGGCISAIYNAGRLLE